MLPIHHNVFVSAADLSFSGVKQPIYHLRSSMVLHSTAKKTAAIIYVKTTRDVSETVWSAGTTRKVSLLFNPKGTYNISCGYGRNAFISFVPWSIMDCNALMRKRILQEVRSQRWSLANLRPKLLMQPCPPLL